MYSKKAQTFRLKTAAAVFLSVCAVLCPSHAQEVIVPTATAARQLLEDEPRAGLRLGHFDIYPRVGAMVLYDDNIFSHSQVKESDVIWSLAPAASFMLGEPGSFEKTLTLDYSPNVLIFTDHDEYNTVDHSARVAGVWPFSRLTLGFSQDFALTSVIAVNR